MKRNTLLAPLLVAAMAAVFALGLYGTSWAAPKKNIPFPNPAQQRLDTVTELRVIASLLRDQNKMLKEQNAILKEINGKTAGVR